jgi:hypothetical protein
VTNNGGPCSDEELDSECDDKLDSDDKSTLYNQFIFFYFFKHVKVEV